MDSDEQSPRMVNTSIRVQADRLERFRALARSEGRTVGSAFRLFMDQRLDRLDEQEGES